MNKSVFLIAGDKAHTPHVFQDLIDQENRIISRLSRETSVLLSIAVPMGLVIIILTAGFLYHTRRQHKLRSQPTVVPSDSVCLINTEELACNDGDTVSSICRNPEDILVLTEQNIDSV